MGFFFGGGADHFIMSSGCNISVISLLTWLVCIVSQTPKFTEKIHGEGEAFRCFECATGKK